MSTDKKADKSRRRFLQVAGGTVAAGVAAPILVRASGGPKPQGKQWAMVVNATKCKGCEKCSVACHNLHNVPWFKGADGKLYKDAEQKIPWPHRENQEIKWLWKEPYENTFTDQQHGFAAEKHKSKMFPVMCNHCANPTCVRVCPPQATWKRESDGIVMMDMHRCIGCRYCIVACPYGSRSFNFFAPWPRPHNDEDGTPPNLKFPTRKKGAVEKCNFCAELLAEAQRQGKETYTPGCVAACPNGSLVFGDVSDPYSAVRKLLDENHTIVRKPGLGTGPQIYYIV